MSEISVHTRPYIRDGECPRFPDIHAHISYQIPNAMICCDLKAYFNILVANRIEKSSIVTFLVLAMLDFGAKRSSKTDGANESCLLVFDVLRDALLERLSNLPQRSSKLLTESAQ